MLHKREPTPQAFEEIVSNKSLLVAAYKNHNKYLHRVYLSTQGIFPTATVAVDRIWPINTLYIALFVLRNED
jgi:hypothetical protein